MTSEDGNEKNKAKALLDKQVEEVERLASDYEQESRKMVRRSIRFDALTVIFGAASPALTTFVAYDDILQGVQGTFFKLGVILVVAIAVSLPALKRILGIKKYAVHASASAMELHKAVSIAHDEKTRIGDDIRPEKQEQYYNDLYEQLRSRVSEVREKRNRLIFDIMEESHGIAEREAKKERESKNEQANIKAGDGKGNT